MRLCDLRLSIRGSAVAPRIRQLYRELEAAGLRFRPYIWFSSDWFTPDSCTGFAIPFYLAHPRLARLEQRQMLTVEGGGRRACLKLLRHETAHALDNAYRLRRRARWKRVFGAPSEPYEESYMPRPTSRSHVHNLDYWYAQSHPVEDFAETFAVWLRPGSRWQTAYAGWPALAKLEYVDALMDEIARRRPRATRIRPDSLPQLRMTLREYYKRKRAHYGADSGEVGDHDEFLRRIFASEIGPGRRQPAAGFLARNRRELRSRVASVTGQHPYVVDHVLADMIGRARSLRLHLMRSERETRMDAAALLTALTMTFLRRQGEYSR